MKFAIYGFYLKSCSEGDIELMEKVGDKCVIRKLTESSDFMLVFF